MKRLAGLFILCIIAACSDSMKVPPDVIRKDKMEKVLWDMLQTDRFINTYIRNRPDSTGEKKKEAAVYYERVFQLHGISREEFIKSYKFYLSRPDITMVMFDSISARAERRRAEAHAPKRNPILQKRDSLMRMDSIRKKDSIDKAELEETTEDMSDSALRKALFDSAR